MDRLEREAYEAAVKQYLAKGGKITVCEPGARSEEVVTNVWAKAKKKKEKLKKEVD